MKKNTQLILLSSYVPSGIPQEKGMRNYQFYYELFSGMSEGGIRATVFQLVEKRYLVRMTVNKQSYFKITDAGMAKLSMSYPTLKIKERKKSNVEGHLLLLLKPSDNDPHFIKLRKLLAQQMCIVVTRGVYFYPFSVFPSALMSTILDSYSSSVSIAEVARFSLAIPDRSEFEFKKHKKLTELLSGVSRKMTELIDKNSDDKRLSYQTNVVIHSFFDIMVEVCQPQSSSYFSNKVNRDLFYQACEEWCSLIESSYFSRK